MIQGTGIDMVDIPRIAALIEEHGDRFLERVFTPKEIAFCRQFPHPDPRPRLQHIHDPPPRLMCERVEHSSHVVFGGHVMNTLHMAVGVK